MSLMYIPPMRATLVIPTLNEKDGIGYTLDSFREASKAANQAHFSKDPIEWDILVVDGGSTDGTIALAEERGARVVVERRKGYGRAYRTGFEQATGDLIATMDGDGTYPADELPWLILKLQVAGRDFVSGDRLTLLEKRAMTMEHRIGNWLLNTLVKFLFHSRLKGVPMNVMADSQSGMWVFHRKILGSVRLFEDGMAFSEELKLEVLVRGFKFEEVPIHYAERWGQPKLSSWKDGLRNAFWLFKKRFKVSQETRLAARMAVAPSTTNSP